MPDPKTLGLINALLANRADTPTPTPSGTLSSLSRGPFGLDNGLGALSSFHAPQPRIRGALEQILARSEHEQIVQKLGAWLVSNQFSDIKMDLPERVKPDRIVWTDTKRGHEPDATAYYGLKQHVFATDSTSSSNTISGSRCTATENPSRAYMPLE